MMNRSVCQCQTKERSGFDRRMAGEGGQNRRRSTSGGHQSVLMSVPFLLPHGRTTVPPHWILAEGKLVGQRSAAPCGGRVTHDGSHAYAGQSSRGLEPSSWLGGREPDGDWTSVLVGQSNVSSSGPIEDRGAERGQNELMQGGHVLALRKPSMSQKLTYEGIPKTDHFHGFSH